MRARESRAPALFDATPGSLTTCRVERDGSAGGSTRLRTTSGAHGVAERTGSGVRCDLLQTGLETGDGLEMSALAALLSPEICETNSRKQQHDHQVNQNVSLLFLSCMTREMGPLEAPQERFAHRS